MRSYQPDLVIRRYCGIHQRCYTGKMLFSGHLLRKHGLQVIILPYIPLTLGCTLFANTDHTGQIVERAAFFTGIAVGHLIAHTD